MAIAKGSKSKLIWVEESTFNVAPLGPAYYPLEFSQESIVENINKIISADITSDRQVPAIRGGNIMTGGSVTADFGPDRWARWLLHLLAGTMNKTTVGKSALTPGLVISALASGAITRGTYVLSHGGVYLCIKGGTITSGEATTGLISTSGQEVTATSGCVFEYLRDDTALFYKYVITAGVDFPTVGITIEKQILGGNADLLLSFTGGRLNTLGLTIPQEGIVQAAWGYLGIQSVKQTVTQSGTIEEATNDDPFTGFESFLLFGAGQVARPVNTGNINITNNVEENIYTWGSRFRRDLPGNRREVNGQLTLYFEDTTEYDVFKGEVSQLATISFNRQGKYLAFDMPETKLTGTGTPQISAQGAITAQFNIDAFHESGFHDVGVTIYSTMDKLNSPNYA